MDLKIILIVLIIFIKNGRSQIRKFPSNFQIGVSTSAYQVEGAWNEDGKGENIWDRFTHTHPEIIRDQTTGDIACDSYHNWEKDIALIKDLGVKFYRFSISWSRLLPTGFSNQINPAGVRYYNNIIDKLLQNNIEPMVTLYHWDLPQPLQDLGGMTNPLIVKYFSDYVTVVFSLFGDRVKKWTTFNEPLSVCLPTYEEGNHAPGIKMPGIGCYICSKVLLLAHAKAYHVYDKNFRKTQNGAVGITINTFWYEPKTSSEEDAEAAERALQMNYGWFVNPIFSENGDFPNIMRERIDNYSKAQNYSESRLPVFTPAQIEHIKGSADFLGLNYYTTRLAKATNSSPSVLPTFENDVGVDCEINPQWKKSATDWLVVTPWGLRKLLNWIKDTYNNPLVYISENGYADMGEINDYDRVEYHQDYMSEVLNAIGDGCNIQRYTIWSLLDNMEWSFGYTLKFGIYYVNFSSPERTRIPKKSVCYFKNVISQGGLPTSANDTLDMNCT